MNWGLKWLRQCGLAHDWDTYDSLLSECTIEAPPTYFGAMIIAVLFQRIENEEACELKDEIFNQYTRDITPTEVLSDKFECDCPILFTNHHDKFLIIRDIAEKWRHAKQSADPFIYIINNVRRFGDWSEITAKRLARYSGWENLAPPGDAALSRAYTKLREKYKFDEPHDFDKFINQRKFDDVRGIMCEVLYHYADKQRKLKASGKTCVML